MKLEGHGEYVYIAGPMRGMPNHNRAAFRHAEELLASSGFRVMNPSRIGEGIAPEADLERDASLLETVMGIEREVIRHCAAIYLLRGWQTSKGAREELRVALVLNKPIYLEPEEVSKW